MTEIETMLGDALGELSKLSASKTNELAGHMSVLEDYVRMHDARLERLEQQGTFLLQLLNEQSKRLVDLTTLLDDLRRRLEA